MNRKLIDLWVGFFVIFGIAAIIFLALRVGNLASANFSETYVLTANFDNIGGSLPSFISHLPAAV